ASVTAKVRYNIEVDWDYAYLVVSTDGGANWTTVNTNLSTNTSPNGQNFGEGITGVSTGGGWVNLTATLPVSGNILIGFRYWTDGAQQGTPGAPYQPGFSVDELSIAGGAADGAETDAGWTFSPASGGFHATSGSESRSFHNYYLAEFRQYRGFDKALELGPYNFDTSTHVEHFPDQDGMLVWYWDTSFGDNNVGDHPGGGLILPIDAHPGILHWDNGSTARPRIQTYDATFGLEATDAITLHGLGGLTLSSPSQAAVSTFNDNDSHWVASDPGDAPSNGRYQASWSSVNHPHTGTTIRVQSIDSTGFMQVRVN
ncbi:MAG TPA: hypothetical protein VFY89_10785, partial [Ktedonobacterales bacterium]